MFKKISEDSLLSGEKFILIMRNVIDFNLLLCLFTSVLIIKKIKNPEDLMKAKSFMSVLFLAVFSFVLIFSSAPVTAEDDHYIDDEHYFIAKEKLVSDANKNYVSAVQDLILKGTIPVSVSIAEEFINTVWEKKLNEKDNIN